MVQQPDEMARMKPAADPAKLDTAGHMSGYRPDIDGLRSLAVVPVVLTHAGVAGFSGGFVGVDIFFVISGFLITGILMRDIAKGQMSILRFYERRARRILPALFAVIAACFVVGWFVFNPFIYDQLAKDALTSLLFVSNMWMWHRTGDYFGAAAELQPLLHTWSLSVEEQFYVVFPLILFVVASRWPRAIPKVVVTLSLISFAVSVWATSAYPVANFFFAPTRAWELGLGAMLALGVFPSNIKNKAIVNAVALLGLGLIIASIALLDKSSPFPGLLALPVCLGTVAIIWAGAQTDNIVGRVLSSPLPVFVGLISYSLYLWHWPVLLVARLYEGTSTLSGMMAAIGILISVLLGYLSWRFVERPFRVSADRSGMSAKAIFVFSGTVGAALVGVSLFTVSKDGFVARVPAETMAIYTEAFERSPTESLCDLSRDPKPCVLGTATDADRQPTTFLWGDSHAGSLTPGYDTWLQDTGQVGSAVWKSGCPPTLHVTSVSVDLPSDHNCEIYNQNILGYVAATPSIETVYLAARWPLAVTSEPSPNEYGNPLFLRIAEGVEVPFDTRSNEAVLDYGLTELVTELNRLNRRVVIVESVPEMGRFVPDALIQSSFIGPPFEPITRAEYDTRNSGFYRILARLAETTEFDRINVVDLMCDVDCIYIQDGRPLYRDDDHLSILGSNTFAPLFFGQH